MDLLNERSLAGLSTREKKSGKDNREELGNS